MNISYAGLALVAICFILILVFTLVFRKRPQRFLRSISSFSRLRQAIGLAVEDGSRLHISLGRASPFGMQAAASFVGLSVLDRIAQLSSISDRPPVATSGDGALSILSQDTLSGTYRNLNAPDLYDPSRGMMAGPTPWSYIAGALPVQQDENVSANILLGSYGSEVILLADAAEARGQFTLAASDSLPAQAVLFATAQEPLIGEELYATGAYVNANPSHLASLRTQDILRLVLMAGLLLGAVVRLVLSFLNVKLF